MCNSEGALPHTQEKLKAQARLSLLDSLPSKVS